MITISSKVLWVIAIAFITDIVRIKSDDSIQQIITGHDYWIPQIGLTPAHGGISWYNAVWDLPATDYPLNYFEVSFSTPMIVING